MADDVHKAQPHDLFLHRKRHGEEQFVVLAAVQSRNDRVRVHLLGQRRGLPGDRDAFEVDARAAGRRFAELHQVARQAVREVDHRRGADLFFGQRTDDVGAGARLEVFFKQVFVALELRLGVLHVGEHPLFAFEQLQAHVGGPEVARDADEVVLLRTAAVDDLLLFGVAKRGDGDDQPRHRGARVAAHEVDLLLLAGEGDAFVEVLKGFDGQFRRDAERHGDLRREGVHGQDVAHAGRHGLVTQVFERKIGEVEIDAFVEGVGRAEHRFAASRGDHRGVVPRALERRGVLRGESAGQQVDESELSEAISVRFFWSMNLKFFTKLRKYSCFPKK